LFSQYVFPLLWCVRKKKTYTSNIPVNANHATPFGITNVLHIAPVFGKAAVLDMIDSAR